MMQNWRKIILNIFVRNKVHKIFTSFPIGCRCEYIYTHIYGTQSTNLCEKSFGHTAYFVRAQKISYDLTLCDNYIAACFRLLSKSVGPHPPCDLADIANTLWLRCIFIAKWAQNKSYPYLWLYLIRLAHIPLNKMTVVSQTTFSYAFSWMKNFVFCLEFHWRLFSYVQFTIIQHRFR